MVWALRVSWQLGHLIHDFSALSNGSSCLCSGVHPCLLTAIPTVEILQVCPYGVQCGKAVDNRTAECF